MSWYHDRRAQRAAVAALTTLAVVDVVHTVLSIGSYEDRITVVTHGSPDLGAPAFAYALFAYVVEPLGRVLQVQHLAGVLSELLWVLAVVLAAAAVSAWWRGVRGTPWWDRAILGWVAAAVGLKVTSVVYDGVTAPGYQLVDGALSTRPVAYSLWLVSTVVLVVAARVLTSRIRRSCGPHSVARRCLR